MSATVITRGAAGTRIAHSDQLAARILQQGLAEKRAEGPVRPKPVAVHKRDRRVRPILLPRKGLPALRGGVERVADMLAWLQDIAAGMPEDQGYLYMIGEDAAECAFASHVLGALSQDAGAFGSPRAVPGAPADLEIAPLAGGVARDLAPQRYLSVIRWGADPAQEEIAAFRLDDLLIIGVGDQDQMRLSRPDHAGAITLVLGDTHLALRPDPVPARPGLMDVVL